MKLNDISFYTQVDTRSDVTLIRRNFWDKMGTRKLRKSNLQLKQFDRSVIKVMGIFHGTFETKKPTEMIPIMVAACNKDHGL